MCNGLRLKSDQDELDAVLDPARLLEPVSHTLHLENLHDAWDQQST
jgi:hypothetical protein